MSLMKKMARLIQQDMKMKKLAKLTVEQKIFIDKVKKISDDSMEHENKYNRIDYNKLVEEAKTLFSSFEVKDENSFEFEEDDTEGAIIYIMEFEPDVPYTDDSTGVILFGRRDLKQMMKQQGW